MQIALFESSARSRMIGDMTNLLRNGTITSGQHGDEECTIDLAVSPSAAARLFQYVRTPHLDITQAGAPLYSGRVEELEIGGRSTRLTAYGYWRALADVPYTALWSHVSTADWRPVQTTEIANCSPNRYRFDNNNRLYITTDKTSSYQSTTYAAYAYRLPDQGNRYAYAISGNYVTNLPSATWRIGVLWYSAAPGDAAWTQISSATIATGTGSGSFSQVLTGSPVAVALFLQYNSVTPTTPAAEADTYYARFTGVRVTSQATPILLSNIAADMVNVVSGVNSAQLSSSTVRIAATTTDRYEEVYEDADMRQILERLALAEGDYVVGVDRDRRLYLHAPGTYARTWAVERADLRLTRILNDVTNSAYGVYQESDGYALRTATSANSAGQTRYGVTRRSAVDAAQTTSSSVAGTIRDAFLADNAAPPPRAAITIQRGGIATSSGGRVPGWMVQSGDTLRIRQLPPDLALSLDQLSTFRVGRRTYDLMTGETTIEPLNAPDTLAVYLAQRENRNKAIMVRERGDG